MIEYIIGTIIVIALFIFEFNQEIKEYFYKKRQLKPSSNNNKLLTATKAQQISESVLEQKRKEKEEEVKNSKINQELLAEILKLIQLESEKGSRHLFLDYLEVEKNVSYRVAVPNFEKYSKENYIDVSRLLHNLGYEVTPGNNDLIIFW